MLNINHFWAQLIVEELIRNGINFFCLAPGSRSTPLTTAVARHPKARHVMHFDERGTAFCALGYARATGRPAVWITTSGTAVANGLPAAVEAGTDGVPLLMITADRPPELRETSANQTIDQVKLFGKYARWQFDVPAPTPSIDPAAVLTTVDQAAYRTRRSPAGPVHLNCMFRKPLAPEAGEHDIQALAARLEDWSTRPTPYTRYEASAPTVEKGGVRALWDELRTIERGLVVAGRLDAATSPAPIREVAGQLQWPLLADVGSGLRLGSTSAGIACYDQMLTSEDVAANHEPEAVLHLGGRFVSKRLLQFLDEARPHPYAVVHHMPFRNDPNHQVTHRLEVDPAAFCRAVLDAPLPDRSGSSWLSSWQDTSALAEQHISSFLEGNAGLSEPLTARLLSRHIPADHGLVLANSMPVRHMDRFATTEGPAVPSAANRGASGIDGTLATAAGYARGLQSPVTLLTGDLALLHDLNSLALLRQSPHPVIVVVLNNHGGGIFSFLPIAHHDDVFEPFFGTPHDLSFEQSAAQFDLHYEKADTKETFLSAYQRACARNVSALVEIQTDRAENHALHEQLASELAEAL